MTLRFLRNIPIRRKITVITMLTSGVALLVACIAFVAYEQITFRRTMATELSVLTDLFDDNVASGLTFNDPKSITTTLKSLNAHQHILAAAVYDKTGQSVATYQRADLKAPFPVPAAQETGTHFEVDRLDAFRRIVLDGENIGTIYIASDLHELTARFWRYGVIVSLVLLLSSLVALALSAKLQHVISGPISHLAGVAGTVAKDKNYSIRATKHGEDELGRLIDGFNEMLNQIQARDGALQEAHGTLEKRVEERTRELATSLSLLNATLDSMADSILAVDLTGKVICYNKKFAALWGMPDELLMRGDHLELVAHGALQTKDPDQYLQRIQELHAQAETEAFDVLELKDGRTIERYAQPQRIGNECVGRVLNFRDITARKRVETELAHQRHLLQSLMDHSPDHIYFKDLDSRFLSCSQFLAVSLGLKSQVEALGKRDFDFFEEKDARLSFEDEQEIIRTGRPLLNKIEKEFWVASGKTAWSLTTKMPLRNPAGEIVGTFGISKDITEQKNKEEELRRTQVFLNSVVENLPIGVFIKEAKELRFVLWSKGNEELIGIPRDEILGKNDGDFFTGEQAAAFVANDRETLAQGHVVNVTEESVQTRHQGERTLLTRKVPILDEDGQPAYLLGISEDITERKRTEAALRETDEKFRQLADNITDVFWMRSPDMQQIHYISPAFERIWGVPTASLYANPQQWVDAILPEDRERVRAAFAELTKDVPSVDLEYRITRPDGSVRWIQVRGFQVRDGAGQLVRLTGIVTDITERKRAEESLRQKEAFGKAVLNSLNANIAVLDASATIIAVNQTWEEFAQKNGAQLSHTGVGTNYLEVLRGANGEWATEAPRALAGIRAVLDGTLKFFTLEYPCHSPQEKRWFQLFVTPLSAARDGAVVAHVNVTERKRAENAVRSSEERFRSLIENASDIITLLGTDGTLLYESPSMQKVLGYTPEDVVGQNCLQFIHAEDTHLVQGLMMKLGPIPGSTATAEYRFRHQDGTWRVLESLGRNLLHDPNVAAIVVNSRDVTERKRAEVELEKTHRQLVDTSRQAGMAEVATGVLHNVGNVLNSVNVSATLLSEQAKKSKISDLAEVVALMEEHSADLAVFITQDPRGRQLLGFLAQLSSHLAVEQTTFLKETEQLRKNVEHIKDIVAMQQSYAKVSGVTETLNISDLVEDALRMNAAALTRHEVEVVREFAEIAPITLDKHKVLQVLVNLIRNAKYACDESGRVDKRMTVRVANGGGQVRIAIIDNGVGIPPENLTRIFNHGFTTRKEGHGFGLHSGALAAKEMGGSLQVQSAGLGQGATFTLELPCEIRRV